MLSNQIIHIKSNLTHTKVTPPNRKMTYGKCRTDKFRGGQVLCP